MDLHELTPVGGRAPGRRDGRRLERLAKMREGLTSRGRSHPGLLPLANLRFEVSRLQDGLASPRLDLNLSKLGDDLLSQFLLSAWH